MKLTTVIEFEDRFEGQVLHSGTADECQRIAQLIPAISYSGPDKILKSMFVTVEDATLDLPSGERWRIHKEQQ